VPHGALYQRLSQRRRRPAGAGCLGRGEAPRVQKAGAAAAAAAAAAAIGAAAAAAAFIGAAAAAAAAIAAAAVAAIGAAAAAAFVGAAAAAVAAIAAAAAAAAIAAAAAAAAAAIAAGGGGGTGGAGAQAGVEALCMLAARCAANGGMLYHSRWMDSGDHIIAVRIMVAFKRLYHGGRTQEIISRRSVSGRHTCISTYSRPASAAERRDA
jgi:hypothetical protein